MNLARYIYICMYKKDVMQCVDRGPSQTLFLDWLSSSREIIKNLVFEYWNTLTHLPLPKKFQDITTRYLPAVDLEQISRSRSSQSVNWVYFWP